MAAEEKWYFTREQLANTPSRKCGVDADRELSSRQQAANFIQDMGQRLQVTQLCINTAIVYMHRFYMFHSFTRFHRNAMAAAALFLAAKVEEQPRKLEHVIKVAQMCLQRGQPPLDIKSEVYMEQAQELVVNENILLQTLGFDVAIDHPHTHVVRCCTLVRASKDLAQTSYFMASNSLHLTTMCLQYKPTVVACFCIHLACKWSNWEIPQSNEGKPWFWYVDKSVTQELLEQLTEEFLVIFEKCPSRLKKKIMSLSSNQHSQLLASFNNENQQQQQQAIQESNRNGEGSAHQSGMRMPYLNSGPGSSNSNLSEEMNLKRKMDYNQRHHADYKKPHLSSHHSRSDNSQNMPVKSSCMFGPPTRTQPPPPHSTNISSSTTSLTPSSSNSVNSGQRPPSNHKPIPPEQRPRRPDGHHVQPYKKDYHPQQPPTVEVPKPAVPPAAAPTVKVERSIFSPEVPLTPEPKPEPVTRIKEEKIEEPPPVAILPVIKEEKLELKQEPAPVEVKPEPVPPPPPPPPTVPTTTVTTQLVEEPHKEVKKKKKKHKEHKEHKEHKDKHKDKHKHKKDKHKEPGPIVITIPKDKLTLPKEQPLKIKIPKDRIAPLSASPVKLKIPKEKLKESRKRERSGSPDLTPSKRSNGDVQVTKLELEENEMMNRILAPISPLGTFDLSENVNNSNPVQLRIAESPPPVPTTPPPEPSPPQDAPPPSSQRPRYSHPKINNRYNNSSYNYYKNNSNNNLSQGKYRSGGPRGHYNRPGYSGRGRPPRYPRPPQYYQTHYRVPPPQPQQVQFTPAIPQYQYYYPTNSLNALPTYPAPPPLPDEPPPELPPPPPE